MTTDEYNGWTNRETWAAALHLSNDQRLDQVARELVEAGIMEHHATCEEFDLTPTRRGAMSRAGERIADYVNGLVDIDGIYPTTREERMMLDEIGSRWRVDWASVAESFAPEPAEAL